MEKPALTICNASIGYRQNKKAVQIVAGIDATLRCGELVVLIGRNGAGKSTLLRTLSAFQKPLSGNVGYSGKSAEQMSADDIAKEVSVVLTANEPAPLTVREIVSLGRTPYTNFMGRMTAKDNKAVDNALEMMDMLHLENRIASALSDGERQKCMIAKALAQETPVMLLDEPTAFLDYVSKVKLLRTLKKLAKEKNKAILVSTHDIELAVRFADKVWLLSDAVFKESCIDELSENEAFLDFISDAGIRYDKKEKRIEIL